MTHPVVPMIHALATHIEQRDALPDELRDTTIRKFKQLCDSCGCHNAHDLADHLAEEWRPRACPGLAIDLTRPVSKIGFRELLHF